jgi:hypothetical protein
MRISLSKLCVINCAGEADNCKRACFHELRIDISTVFILSLPKFPVTLYLRK